MTASRSNEVTHQPARRRPDEGTVPRSGGGWTAVVQSIWQVADPLCAAEGLELVHVEFQRETRGRTLRLYIDKPGGIRLDDCAEISRQIGDLLDVEELIPGRYHLEVSSPGVERPVSRLSDFERFKGMRIRIQTTVAIGERSRFTGTLGGVADDGMILLELDEGDALQIPHAHILRARLAAVHGDK